MDLVSELHNKPAKSWVCTGGAKSAGCLKLLANADLKRFDRLPTANRSCVIRIVMDTMTISFPANSLYPNSSPAIVEGNIPYAT
jgi:hypothetical protein